MSVAKADFLASFGRRNDAILRTWLGKDVEADRIARIGDAKEECYRALIKEGGLVPLPGAAEWVRALHQAGWRQAIASSAPRLNVSVMREVLGFDELIETCVGAEDVHIGKPHPEVFLIAAERLGVAPARCIVVEDAAAGIEAARRAGMRSIGVGNSGLSGADVVVESLAHLPPDAFDKLL